MPRPGRASAGARGGAKARARHRQRVAEGGENPPEPARRFAEKTELAENRRAVVIDALALQAIALVEREDPAERELDPP